MVDRYYIPRGITISESPAGDFVFYTDYQRLKAECDRLAKALDEAACELSSAGQSLAEFEGFEFRMNQAITKAYAASQRAHDANGYKEVP